MLNIEKTIDGGAASFTLERLLDTVTAPELEQAVMGSLEGVKELTLDFQNLEYISSAGLRVLLSAQKAMMKQGEMKIVNVSETVMEIFEVTGFTDILTIE